MKNSRKICFFPLNDITLQSRFGEYPKRLEESLAQLVEHNTFNVGVSGSSPERVTKEASLQTSLNALLAQLVEQLTLNQRV